MDPLPEAQASISVRILVVSYAIKPFPAPYLKDIGSREELLHHREQTADLARVVLYL